MPAALKLLILLAVGLMAWPSRGEDVPPPLPLHLLECKLPSCVIAQGDEVGKLAIAYADASKHIADLERQLADLKQAKGCAKLEVTEPPRNFVPNKERDS